MTTKPFQIQFDNAGTATFQTEGYACLFTGYTAMQTLAESVRSFLAGESNPDTDWDGNDDEARFDTSTDEYWQNERNGGHKTFSDIEDILSDAQDTGWNNVREFAEAYGQVAA